MKILGDPNASIHDGHARIYLNDCGKVYKMTLHGRVSDLILAASSLVDGPLGRRAVIVDANTRYGVDARRIHPDGTMTHHRARDTWSR